MEIIYILKIGLGLVMVIVMLVAAVAFAPVVERWWTRAFGPPYAQKMLRREEEEKAERRAAERRVAERRAKLEGQRTGIPADGADRALPRAPRGEDSVGSGAPRAPAAPRLSPPAPTAQLPASVPTAGGEASTLDLVNAHLKQQGKPPLGPGSAAKEFLED